MKFYSYSNKNNSYTKAVTLQNVRTVEIYDIGGRSEIRFGVRVTYCDNTTENLPWLERDEAKAVYKQIVDLLNS